jgi:GNAT superfamily N-acetyltransferase
MVQDPTRVSPGDYSAKAYDVLSKYDPAFPENVSVETFFESLQNPDYAAKAYALLADADPELVNNLSLDDFIGNVKKKEEPVVTESVSDAGSSVLLPSTEIPEGALERKVNQFGQEVDELGVVLPQSDSPFELTDYRNRRKQATSQQDTAAIRLADQVQAEELERLEEERNIAAASMPAVPALEGRESPDYVAQLREAYGPYGVRFETSTALGLGEFGSIKAYAVGADGNAVEYNIDIVDGKIMEGQLDGLNEFLQSNARAKGGVDVDKRSLSEKALKVQEMRPVARLNDDGSQSTVLMASAEADGRHFAYPTLFPTGDGFSADPNDWTELEGGAAFDEAQRRGELFEFDTAEEANRFAEGEWKEIRETDAIAEKMWAEKGRNYRADNMFLRRVEEAKKEYEFLESIVPGEQLVTGRMSDRYLDETEIPPAYQQYLTTYTDERGEKKLIARTDIEEIRQQKERELAALEQQFDNDNELLQLKEGYDEYLGQKRGEVMERAATLNQEGKSIQNSADVASINRFGVPVKGLLSMQPETEAEYNEMLGLLTQYNTGIEQRQVAALQYEKNKLYYDAQHEKLINQEYVDGFEEVGLKLSNGIKRGNAMSKLLLMHYGYYDAIGDEGAEERAMREVSEIMDSMDTTRVGRATSRTNMTGTTESFLERINPINSGWDAATYTAALTAESLGQLFPIWYRVALPTAIAGGVAGGTYGAVAGPGGALAGFAGGAVSGFVKAGFVVGMPVSELALEMGNAILEVGEKKGYDWADPNSALLALNDKSVWEEGADRGYKRGVPIMLTGMASNMVMAKAALGGSRVLPLAERLAAAVGTGVTVEPATEMFGEYLALQATGEYTGSTANVKEIAAEGLGAIGMGVGFTTSIAALGYAKDVVTDANFNLAVALMDPTQLAKENVRGERIVSWANKMERLGKLNAEQAEQIRKNVGLRRQANELLGKKVDSRPGGDSQVTGRIMELLEAKQELEKSSSNIFSGKIKEITEEIALIAESGKVEKPGGAAVNLSDIRGRIRNRRAGIYKFNGKRVSQEDFLAAIQEATPRQLRRARAYNDSKAQSELIARRNAISKRGTEEVPVGKRAGFGTEVDEEVREATQEDLQAEEEGSLDTDRKLDILQSIAEKLNEETELTEVEQAFFNDNEEDIKTEQERFKALDQEAADVEVRGESEAQGRVPLKRLRRLASNAKKAMAKNFEGADIIIHADKDSYQQAAQENGLTGEGSAGFLAKDNKTVHVFAPLASGTTIAHETFHVVLRNSVDKAQTQELMGEFVTTLRKVIPADNALAKKLDRFQKRYEEGQMNEEYVAEFFGELAAAYPTLDKKGKSVIARFVERLGKLLGIDLTLSPDLTKRDQQVLSLLERLAGQVSRGETITARETGELSEMARSTSRKQTEDNLSAAEQKVTRIDEGKPKFNRDGLAVVKAAEQKIFQDATPKALEEYFADGFSDVRDVHLALANRPDVRLWFSPIGGGFYFGYDTPKGPEILARFSIKESGANDVELELLEATDAKGSGIGSRFMTDFSAALDETNTTARLMAYPPIWYERDMQGNEADAVAERLVDFYSKFGFTRDREGDTEMTRMPGSEAVAPTREQRLDSEFRNTQLERIEGLRRRAKLSERLINTSFESMQDILSLEEKAAVREAVDPYDDGVTIEDLAYGELSETDVEAVQEFSDVPITSDSRVIENVDDLIEFSEEYADLRDDLETAQQLDSAPRAAEQRVETGTPFTFEYNKNLERAPQMGTQFGQDVEAAGDYVTQSVGFTPEGFETNTVTVQSPLVVDITDATQISYKNELSNRYGGATGEALSDAIRQDGYDAIVTRFDDGSTGEIVLLGGQRTRAAEQRVDVDEVRMRSRAGSRISKGLATYSVKGEKQVEEIENLTREYVKEQAPKAYIKNANILAKYPLVRGVREFGAITTVEEADELYDIYTQQTLDNLRWMMETYPDEFSEVSTLWYDGANKIANEMATRFGVTPEQAAGILASLSPQKDWYQNVRLAELLLEAFEDNPVMTREMIVYQKKKTAEVIKEKKKDLKKARAKKGTSRAKAVVEKFNKDKARLLNDIEVAEALLDAITALEGTRMMDADPSMVGYFVRLHAETTKPISYQVISPDGEMVGPAKKDDGSTAKWAWGSYNEIGKGVSVMLNGSQENITASLGQQHKVRNFYNNIIDPMSAEGDVTMDTHAIAVSLLKPLSTKSDEVNHNFGGKGASSSGAKGIKGTYYANQEAYQMLAEEMGMLPRQIQSVTWEAVRGLFTDKFKGNKENVKAINQIWENYADGKITIDEARAQVLERAGGVNPPVWAESVQRESGEGVREGRERGAGREGGRAAEQRVDVEEVEDKYGDFVPGTRKMIRIDGGRIEIAGNKTFDRSGILELFVPEESRRQGIGTALVKAAIEEADGKLVGMASKDAAITINYNLGMRYYKPDGTEATLEETKKQRAENSYESIFMQTPEARQAGRRGEAAEQRVVDPGVVDVLERYEFKPNKSLKNAELAPELNRNLQRFGYGVKQYGTRMNDFRVVSLDTGRAVDPNDIIAAGVEERAIQQTEERRMLEMERQRELEQRIIEIYNADERPFTGKDFEDRAPEQRVAAEAMAEPGTIADLVARGRELGLRDAAIRSVLLKRFGKDNADAINTALTEYFDMFRAVPEAFGNVEGGIEVGRQIYDDVRRQLDEFARPKKPGRMTKRERTDRIEELRAKFPEQKNLSDTELLRKHPRQAVAPSIAEVRAEALNMLRNNSLFNEQTTEVQEQLLVAFDKTLQTRANKRVNTLMAQIRNNIRQRRKGAKNARTVQDQLRKLINEVIPRTDYGKADIAKLTNLVASVNEDNYFVKAEQVLEVVEKKRGQIRDSVIRDIAKFVADAAKTKRTPSGKVRPRSLDAPGQAYFREANRILRAILNKDQSLIMDIAANLANNPMVDVATQKMLNGEKLTMREQQLVDQKSALDMFAGIQDKSLEEVEAILEDLKVDAGFSRANLKATRAARAARMAEFREGAKAEVQDNWAGFATNEDGSAKTRNQLEADKTQKKTIGDALRENGLRAKYDALVEWAKEGKRLTPAGIARNAANITHVGALTGIMGEYFRENLYKRLGKMEERHLKGVFETKDKLDEMASTIEGIENYKDITDLIFTSNPDGLMVNTKATGRRKLSTDEMMRIYALSKNPVQQAKLEAMGFTDEVMNEIVDAVDNRLLEFVDKTVDYLANDYYEGINDVYSKVNDINLGYIENYFPTRTQVKGDLSVKSKEETLSSTFFGPNAQVATALKERTDQKGEILMDQDLGFHGELGNHFNTMERFKAYAEGVQEMNAILSSDYTVALSGRLRADSMLNMLIAHGVTPDMFMSEMSFKGIDSLISKYTGASLAFKLMQIPKQATSFIGGFQQYRFGDKPNPVTDLIMFFFDYVVLVPQMMLEGVTLGKYKGPIASIAKDSATFRARLESNFSGDVYGLTAGVSGRPRKVSAKDYKLHRKAATVLRKGSGTATAFGDIMGVLGYLPAYNRNRMRGMSQEEAIDLLNEYNETQQSRRPGERTPLQIRQNGLTRAFMAFTSSQILYLNNTLRHANNINKAIRKGEKVKAVDSRGLIFNAVMSSVLFTLASNIFVLLFGNDEEKERAYRDTLWSPIKNFLILPIWGAALEEFYNLYVGNKYPTDVAVDPLGKVVRDVKKVATKGEVVPAVKSVAELALGTNFDPGLSLINIAAGEPIEPELYNLIGVPKSARPE